MPNIVPNQTNIAIKPPPVTVPMPRDVWLARRYGLSPAISRVISELAFPLEPSWVGRRA